MNGVLLAEAKNSRSRNQSIDGIVFNDEKVCFVISYFACRWFAIFLVAGAFGSECIYETTEHHYCVGHFPESLLFRDGEEHGAYAWEVPKASSIKG